MYANFKCVIFYIYLYYFAGDTVALPNDKVYEFRQSEGLISRSVHKKIINQIFPLHDPVILENLKEGWIKRMIKMPPIDDMSYYFGSKIGLYFG